jgi:prepilin-type N-terminal cleavage/methylation domain-containing protein
MIRKAFTLIELIIVIVIMGILVKTAMSFFPDRRLSSDTNYLSLEIKSAQQHAINYDHYRFGDTLWKKRDYTKEYNLTCVDLNITGERRAFGTSTLDMVEDSKNLTKYYHIDKRTDISVEGLSDINQSLCFDNLGRPYGSDEKLIE